MSKNKIDERIIKKIEQKRKLVTLNKMSCREFNRYLMGVTDALEYSGVITEKEADKLHDQYEM